MIEKGFILSLFPVNLMLYSVTNAKCVLFFGNNFNEWMTERAIVYFSWTKEMFDGKKQN